MMTQPIQIERRYMYVIWTLYGRFNIVLLFIYLLILFYPELYLQY